MRKLARDNNGFEVVIFILFILSIIVFIFIILPWIVGWAVTFIIHIFTDRPEITNFWTRWFIGVALCVISGLFFPLVQKVKQVHYHHYHSNDKKDDSEDPPDTAPLQYHQ